MNDINKDNWFDSEIRKKYKDHISSPDDRLWERINAHLSQSYINGHLHLIRILRIAVATLAVIVAGTFAYFEINTSEKDAIIKELSNDQKIKEKFPLQNNTNKSQQENVKKESGSIVHNKNANTRSSYPNKVISSLNSKDQGTIYAINKATSNIRYTIPHDNSSQQKKSGSIQKPETGKQHERLYPVPRLILKQERQKPFLVTSSGRTGSPAGNDILAAGKYTLHTTHPEKYIIKDKTEQSVVKRFSFTLYLYPAVSYRSVADNRAFSVPPYGKSYFNNRDRAVFTLSAGAAFTYFVSPKLKIKPGLCYSNYSYNFMTQGTDVHYAQDYNWLYTSAGRMDFRSNVVDTTLQEALLHSKMRFSYISIPFGVEYDITPFLFINAGMDVSFLVHKGLQMQAEDFTGDFEFQNEDIQKLYPWQINLTVGLGFQQLITKNMSIIINPAIRYALSTLNNQAPVKAYPYAIGLQTGFRYKF